MMKQEYPWLVEGGGIAAYVAGKQALTSQILKESYGTLSQRTWVNPDRIKEDPESIIFYEDIEHVVTLILKLATDTGRCKVILRFLTFFLAECLNMPLRVSLYGPYERWDTSLIRLHIL